MSTKNVLAITIAVVSVLFFGFKQAVAQDRCIVFTFTGTVAEIATARPYLKTEIEKDQRCKEVKFDYGDSEHKKELEREHKKSLGPAEKEWPPNKLAFKCVEQNVDNNAFELAGRAYLSLPSDLVTKSVEMTAVTGCCTSSSCVSQACPSSLYTCWDKNRVCRKSCTGCLN
jgi:hypothetical protein